MAQVKLILREDVDNLGHAGDVVSVKPGYARNYLLPKGKASLATAARVSELEHQRRLIAEEQAKLLKDLAAVRARFEALTLEVSAAAGAEGKLFGSVTTQQVAELMTARGFEVDRRKLSTEQPIKTVGEHIVSVRLHRELVAKVKVIVTASGVVPEPSEDETTDEEARAEGRESNDDSTGESPDDD
jgi:large subunit ribosomal protein L9